jgi:hypothetical protein
MCREVGEDLNLRRKTGVGLRLEYDVSMGMCRRCKECQHSASRVAGSLALGVWTIGPKLDGPSVIS